MPQAEQLIAKYRDHPLSKINGTLLPYRSNKGINKPLKIIAQMADISKPLTCHVARHNFATLSLEYSVPIETVSRALGHSNIKTTQIHAKITTTKMQRDYSNITGYGPWGVTYVNSADDPKNQKH